MIHLDEQKLKDNGLRKPVPYFAASRTEALEFRLPANTAYHLNERSYSALPNDQRLDR